MGGGGNGGAGGITYSFQDSLGGKSIGVMFANIAADVKFYSDTVSTLNFASKSRQIVNQLQVNSVESRPVKVKEVIQPSVGARKRKPSSSYSSKENSGENALAYGLLERNELGVWGEF